METTDRTLEKLLADAEKQGLNDWYVKIIIRRAFHAGLALDVPADPLTGYSNLTAAIKAGEPIDWEHLNGLKVQCVKPGIGTLHGTLERDESRPAYYPSGWWRKGADSLYRSAFIYGWTGYHGWMLWVEGDIPLVRKTADQLEVGTYFTGQRGSYPPRLMYVSEALSSKVVCYTPNMGKSDFPATEWEVIEEYGTFQKPEGK